MPTWPSAPWPSNATSPRSEPPTTLTPPTAPRSRRSPLHPSETIHLQDRRHEVPRRAGHPPREALSELAKLGARLIIQRAVEEEFDAWLGRGGYEGRTEAAPGVGQGFRPRRW